MYSFWQSSVQLGQFFLGSGQSITLADPSILLVYLIVGGFAFIIMRALGELLLSNLDCQSFVDLANQYLGPRVAFVTGWTYWFCWGQRCHARFNRHWYLHAFLVVVSPVASVDTSIIGTHPIDGFKSHFR